MDRIEDKAKGNQHFYVRVLVGALCGAFIGSFELLFYKFDIRHILAAMLAGAMYMAILSLISVYFRKTIYHLIIGFISGCISAIIWWLITRSVSLFLSIYLGAVFGTLFAWNINRSKYRLYERHQIKSTENDENLSQKS